METFLLVLSTFPDLPSAREAGRAVVEEALAACVNLVPGAESIYRWNGKIETGAETLAFFKTTAACYPALEKRLRELHPHYETPEIIAVPLCGGLSSYLQWVRESCATSF